MQISGLGVQYVQTLTLKRTSKYLFSRTVIRSSDTGRDNRAHLT